MSALALRLPGISFTTDPPQLPETLPRMDVAAFVGFAAAGPLDVPVVVEDVQRFREVFGPDVELAREVGDARMRSSHLGPAVEEFFRGGGRRCWVVRVADRARAHRARFPLSGLAGIDVLTGRWTLATTRARAVGSWADGLTVAPVAETVRLPAVLGVDPERRLLELAADAPLVVGDTVRLAVDGGRALAVATVATLVRDRATLVVGWDRLWLLEPVPDPRALPAVVRAAWVTAGGEAPLPAPPEIGPGPAGEPVLSLPPGPSPAAGDLIRLDLRDGAVLAAVAAGPVPSSGTLPDEPGHSVGLTRACLVRGPDGAELPRGPSGTAPVAERLRLSLTVWRGERLDGRLDGAGLDPRHPRYWAALPTDEVLYGALAPVGPGGARRPHEPKALWDDVASPRLPLAGPEGADREPRPDLAWLPLAVADRAQWSTARPSLADTGSRTRLARDGLAEFGAHLFLDPDLTDAGTATLLDRALAKTSLLDPAGRLLGVHALLPVEEVTLLAVPDAGHARWHGLALPRPAVLSAPLLWPPVADGGAATLWWAPPEGAARYVVECAPRPDLRAATTALDGPAPLGPAAPPDWIPGGPGADRAVGLRLPGAGCPQRTWLRVRAAAADGTLGPWSNTVHGILPPADFEGCDEPPTAPWLRLADVPVDAPAADRRPGAPRRLWWDPEPGSAAELEHSTDPGFAVVEGRDVVPNGGEALTTVPDRDATYHRLRMLPADGRGPGPWSNTVVVPAPPLHAQVIDPAPGEVSADLLAVHRAVLRMAAARGDLLAVLSLPEHYHEDAAAAHLSALTGPGARSEAAELLPGPGSTVRPLDAGEAHALSHGALYHPWTVVRGGSGVVATPPDGPLSAVLADTAAVRGPWASPGHRPLESVVALTPALPEPTMTGLLRGGVNVLSSRPAGFLSPTARTLSQDDALSPIGVRRLLVLLRRLALRHGTGYVFEPFGPRLHSLVVRGFERLLADLYQRGAFAGGTPREAFQVVAGDVLDPGGAAAGRFVVELRVAPAQPLAFLRVRLVQSGAGALSVTEV
ncbi:hypothetical protein ACI79J_12800 [Geodermatophilus sp. SYSU D01062]